MAEQIFTESGELLQNRQVVKCPHCGWEYLPAEIFFDYNVLGRPTKIIRDPLGKIIYEEYKNGKEPLAEEKFCCTNCERPFVGTISLKIGSKKEVAELDFSNLESKLF